MKRKYLMILSSLIILMLSLSVVSAAVANGEDNTNDDVSKDIDLEVNSISKNINDDSDKISESKAAPATKEAVINASYSDKKVFALVTDKSGEPLEDVNVHMEVHADSSRGLVKIVDVKTDSEGNVVFDVSDLGPDSYQAHLAIDEEGYDSEYTDVDFTIKGEAVIKAYYSNKKISAHVIDKATNKDLSNVKVNLAIHADSKRGLVKVSNLKTDSNGNVVFDVSDLGPDKYYAYLTVDDKYYDSNLEEVDFTIKKITPPNPPHNDTNNTKPVDMRNTGVPILGLVLVLFAVLGVSYRKY